jgi:cell wall assembly regulator SMI1
MWHDLIHSLDPTAQYSTGADEAQLAEFKTSLGVALPEDLQALLRESNGVRDRYGFCIVWSSEEISRYNQEMRTLPLYINYYRPFVDLLFFADAGNGDRFAFPIQQEKIQQGPVFAWNHEDDTRKVVAASLKSYLEGWLSGEISV